MYILLPLVIHFLMHLSVQLEAKEPVSPIGSEQTFIAIDQLPITVKVIGPVQAQTDLQIIGLFKHKPQGDKMLEALDDLDKRLGGIITSLRMNNQFQGNDLETILLIPPPHSISAKQLMIIGLGEEDSITIDKLHQVGIVALREAVRLGASRVAFAPTIRDQGNAKIPTGDVASTIVQGIIEAYQTEKMLQKKGLAKPFSIQEWIYEAGPVFFQEVKESVEKAIQKNANKSTAT